MAPTRTELEEQIAFLEENLRGLERDWRFIRASSVLGVLALPAALIWGTVAAVVALATVGLTVGVGAYITRGHRDEYEEKLSVAKSRLKTRSP